VGRVVKASAFLRAAEALPLASVAEIVGPGPLLVLAPHPDDESIGCGGLIAAAVAACIAVRIAVLSDGAASHPGVARATMAALRAAEAREAARRLGVAADAVAFLDLPDGALPDAGPARAEAVAALLAFCDQPGTVVATWRHDPHCDHTATWAVATALLRERPRARLLAYPVWGWAYAYPIAGFDVPNEPELGGAPEGWRLPIAELLPTKQRAIHAHRSQLEGAIMGGFRLPDEMLRLASRPFEVFLKDGAER